MPFTRILSSSLTIGSMSSTNQCFFFQLFASARLASSVMVTGLGLWLWVLFVKICGYKGVSFLGSKLWCFFINNIFVIWHLNIWQQFWLCIFGSNGKYGYSMINVSCNLAMSMNRKQFFWQQQIIQVKCSHTQ